MGIQDFLIHRSALNEAQKTEPALAMGGEEKPTKPGAFKVSSRILKLWKDEAEKGPGDMLFPQIRQAIADVPRTDLGKAWGIKDDPHLNDTQDFIAGKPRAAFKKWMRNMHKVSPKLGKYLRRRPENASLIYYIFMIRVSGEMMARQIFKRYFETDSGHHGATKSKMRKKAEEHFEASGDRLFEAVIQSPKFLTIGERTEQEHSFTEADDRWMQEVEALEERRGGKLGGRVYMDVQNVQPGDFGGVGSSVRRFAIRVWGNTFPIKDELKKLGFRFDRKSREPSWIMYHAYSTHPEARGAYRGSVSEKKIKATIPKVEKLVQQFNKANIAKNQRTIARVGFQPEGAPKNLKQKMKKIESGIRRKARLGRYGIDVDMRWTGSGTVDEADIVFKGNTYPVRDLLKRVGFEWDASSKTWSMPYSEYNRIRSKFESTLAKQLKREFGNKPGEDPRTVQPGPHIKTRLKHYKQAKSEPFEDEADYRWASERMSRITRNAKKYPGMKVGVREGAGILDFLAGSSLEERATTFKAAREELLDYLEKQHWQVKRRQGLKPLKIMHATSPDGDVKLWFKSQAVYYSWGRGSFKDARSLHIDIRRANPSEVVKAAERRLQEGLQEQRGMDLRDVLKGMLFPAGDRLFSAHEKMKDWSNKHLYKNRLMHQLDQRERILATHVARIRQALADFALGDVEEMFPRLQDVMERGTISERDRKKLLDSLLRGSSSTMGNLGTIAHAMKESGRGIQKEDPKFYKAMMSGPLKNVEQDVKKAQQSLGMLLRVLDKLQEDVFAGNALEVILEPIDEEQRFLFTKPLEEEEDPMDFMTFVTEAKAESGLFGPGGAGGYALEIIRGMSGIDHAIKSRGGSRRGAILFHYQPKGRENQGMVSGTIKVTPQGDDEVNIEVATHGRRPASLMFQSSAPSKKVANSDIPKKILSALKAKKAFVTEGVLDEASPYGDKVPLGLSKRWVKWIRDHGGYGLTITKHNVLGTPQQWAKLIPDLEQEAKGLSGRQKSGHTSLIRMIKDMAKKEDVESQGVDLAEAVGLPSKPIKKGDHVQLTVKTSSGKKRVYEIDVDYIHKQTEDQAVFGGRIYKRDKKSGSMSPGGSYASVQVYGSRFESQVVVTGTRHGRVSAGTRYKLIGIKYAGGGGMKESKNPVMEALEEVDGVAPVDINRAFIKNEKLTSDQLFEAVTGTMPLAKTVQERTLEESRLVIGAGGLQKPGGGKVSILPNREYWLGASSSPQHIIVTKVSDDRVTYRTYPYDKDHFIQKWIAADLIEKGSTTHLKRYGQYMGPEDKRSLEDLLKGGKGKKVSLKDFEQVTVLVGKGKGHEERDLWREAERYGNVGGLAGPSGDMSGTAHDFRYEIDTNRKVLKKLQKDKRFEVMKVSKR